MKYAALCLGLALVTTTSIAAESGDGLREFLAGRAARDAEMARSIWEFAEVGYQETKSTALLQQELAKAGFKVEAGVAGIPTAFVATAGSGKPVIGILAEYDALPGINQDAVPDRKPIDGKDAGHACGHHLFGTASVSAGIALADWLKKSGTPGTIRVYGTPAEEGGSGKVYMVRAGLFNDVDAVMHWHASDVNFAGVDKALSNKSAKFRFRGLSAHASGAPDKGRSALDGVEAMNVMANMMREHVPSDARMHYVITIGGTHNLLANEVLARVMNEKLNEVGGFAYTPEEQAFGAKIYATLMSPSVELDSHENVQAFDFERPGLGSTDVGDVSWTVPTVGLRTATWVPGTSAHSWQATAAGGMTIGYKGMNVASQTLALAGRDLFTSPDILAKARAEFEERRGADFQYRALLGDRAPALDYRKSVAGGAK